MPGGLARYADGEWETIDAAVSDAEGIFEFRNPPQLEEGEAEVARREWERMHPDEEPSSPLVLREPQFESIQAQVSAARAAVQRAKLDLERSSVFAPFDLDGLYMRQRRFLRVADILQ